MIRLQMVRDIPGKLKSSISCVCLSVVGFPALILWGNKGKKKKTQLLFAQLVTDTVFLSVH